MLNEVPEGVVWAIFLLPLGSFAVISLAALLGLTRPSTGAGRAVWDARLSGYVTVAAIAASFILALWVLDSVLQEDGARIGFNPHEWAVVEPLRVEIGVTIDGL